MLFLCIVERVNRNCRQRNVHTYSDTQTGIKALDSFQIERSAGLQSVTVLEKRNRVRMIWGVAVSLGNGLAGLLTR
jgi:hypothetical protein